MKVTFLTPSVSRAYGGIFEIERDLAIAMATRSNTQVNVVGLHDARTEQDMKRWEPLAPKVQRTVGPTAFGYSPDLLPALLSQPGDVLHLHGLWMYTSVASRLWHLETSRPYMVTVHGMLDRWAVTNSRWKKFIAWWLYEHKNLRDATCLQVNTHNEYQAVRESGIETPICIIPNGVSLPRQTTSHEAPWKSEIPSTQNVLLFLGRIHPKKGIDELLDAWKLIKRSPGSSEEADWALAVVGWDDGGHETRLRQRVQREDIRDVYFLGPMFGSQKAAAFSNATAFVLPSFSEGLPMAVLEAWSYRLPVLMTPDCNLDIGFEEGAARKINTEPRAMANTMVQFFSQDKEGQIEMGRRGWELVSQQFSWERVARELHDVYRWMAGDAARPDTVHID